MWSITSSLILLFFVDKVFLLPSAVKPALRPTSFLKPVRRMESLPGAFLTIEDDKLNSRTETHFNQDLYVSFQEDNSSTMVLTLPNNTVSQGIAKLIIHEVRQLYLHNGFQRASVLLQYSLWPLVIQNFNQEVYLGVLFLTKVRNTLEVAGTGPFWVGLFRGGSLHTSSTFLEHFVNYNAVTTLEGLFINVAHSLSSGNGTASSNTPQVWEVENDDIVVISGCYLPVFSQYDIEVVMQEVFERDTNIEDIIRTLWGHVSRKNEIIQVLVALKILEI